MIVIEGLVQGTDEWRRARAGSLGSSRVADAFRRTKTGWGASRANLMAELLIERLTGIPTEHYISSAMAWGTQTEPEARAEYEFQFDAEIVTVGMVRHPTLANAHASPDGLIGDDGMVEFKCPLSATHLETLLLQKVPSDYFTQMQWQMACTGRKWCDYVSFDPRMPQKLRMFRKRIAREQSIIDEMNANAETFLNELANKVHELKTTYGEDIAA